MPELDDLHLDCRHFRWDRPCEPHKRRGAVCPGCTDYDPVERRVLMVKLAATGDVLRTTALLPAVHAAFPRASVTWVTAPAAVGLFDRNPLVDRVLGTGDAATSAALSVREFDAVLCPDADPAAAALAASVRSGDRRGFTMDAGGRVLPLGEAAARWFRMGLSDEEKRANRETYQRLVAAALGLDPRAVGEPILEPGPEDRDAAARFRAGLGFAGELIGLNTGAGARWPYKQWTFQHQASLVDLATSAGLGVLLLGGPEERERHRRLLVEGRGRPVFDTGTGNSFSRFAALVELCRVVVTGDTFALHVAAARKRPTIALFGPTSSAEVDLYGRGEKIAPDMDCLCCYLPRCDKKPYCQELIDPDRVWQAVRAHL